MKSLNFPVISKRKTQRYILTINQRNTPVQRYKISIQNSTPSTVRAIILLLVELSKPDNAKELRRSAAILRYNNDQSTSMPISVPRKPNSLTNRENGDDAEQFRQLAPLNLCYRFPDYYTVCHCHPLLQLRRAIKAGLHPYDEHLTVY